MTPAALPENRLCLDANILMRAIFGVRTASLIDTYRHSTAFCTPDICVAEVRSHIPEIARMRQLNEQDAQLYLDYLLTGIKTVDQANYSSFADAARRRIARRDPDDWPTLAAALLNDCPIWTEDQDFFGCGVATWNSYNVEIYLREA